jgi:uncharacterized protein
VDAPFSNTIGTLDELRALYRDPGSLVQRKKRPALDDTARRFVAASPFCLVSTAAADGTCDVSPRGGPPGFVRVLDERHLAVPDLNGNNLLDSLSNIVANPQASLLLLRPGIDETLRAEGPAFLTTDPDVLELWDDELRRPKVAIALEINTVFMHCAKAFRRGRVWDAQSWSELGGPDGCEMLQSQLSIDMPLEELRVVAEKSYAADLAYDAPEPT